MSEAKTMPVAAACIKQQSGGKTSSSFTVCLNIKKEKK